MTVIVQQPTDSNGNPQPMAYDSDTKKIIVDSNGFIVSGGQRLVNVPSKADYVSTPKTQSSGFLEAWNYSQQLGVLNGGHPPVIQFTAGAFDINAAITLNFLPGGGSPEIVGAGHGIGTYINCNVNDAYAITLNPANASGYNIAISGLVPIYPSGFTPYGFLNADFSTENAGSNTFIGYDLNIGNNGWGESAIYLNSFQQVHLYNWESYSGNSTGLYIENSPVEIIGGFNNGAVTIYNTPTCSLSMLDYGPNFTVGEITQLNILGGGGVHFTLNGNVQNITILAVTLDPYSTGTAFQSSSSSIWTIGNIFSAGIYYDYTNAMNFIGSGITLKNFQFANVIDPNNTLTLPQKSPAISANPPVSATVYQNTNPYDIEIDLPAYATTSGTAGYVTVAKGATSTPSAIGNQYVSGDTSDTSEQIIRLRVPAGWYYEFVASGVTFGTASVFAD